MKIRISMFVILMAFVITAIPSGAAAKAAGEKPESASRPVPVILDTDIGDDIDDSWALTMLLKSPQFDVKLITTTCGKAEYRAKLIAKMLTVAGRTEIPIGLGAGGREGTGVIGDWVQDYRLSDYSGKIREDGAKAIVETVNAMAGAKRPVTIIAIGPLQTLEAALKLDPGIAPKADFVGMHGSVRKGYDNNPKPCVEYNMGYVPGAKSLLRALAEHRHYAVGYLRAGASWRPGIFEFEIERGSAPPGTFGKLPHLGQKAEHRRFAGKLGPVRHRGGLPRRSRSQTAVGIGAAQDRGHR